jgi:nitrogen fixation NifU-like protein
MYSTQVLDHFEHPRNAGLIADPDASAQLENPACGDVVRLTIRISGDRIDDIRFLAKGCVPSIACASALTELAKGKTIEHARELKREELINAVSGLPAASLHASHLAMDALSAVLDQLAGKIRE